MEFTEQMFRFVVKELKGDFKLSMGILVINFEKKFERITFREALIKHTGIDFEKVKNEEDLRKLIKDKKIIKWS